MEKITCKECIRTCCDGIEIRRRDKSKGVDPNKLEIGSLMVVQGVIWKRLKSGLWRCIAFDAKARLCKIWRYRPHLCRYWTCGIARFTEPKEVSNIEEVCELQLLDNYSLHFSVAPSDLMKVSEDGKQIVNPKVDKVVLVSPSNVLKGCGFKKVCLKED